MKLIVCMLVMLISNKECNNKEQLVSQSISEVKTTESAEIQLQNDMKITYQAVSRGFFLTITLEGDSISFSNDRNLESAIIHKITKEEKEAFSSMLNTIDESKLPNLEAPSTRHQFDGAAIATLEISTGENSFQTGSFDHGNPPESIKSIVEKLLSIKTTIEKQ